MTNSPIGGRTVLCVGDDPQARSVFAEVLFQERPTFARNAYEGIRELHAGIFDMYLLDYWLPDWSGVQLCRQIRKVDPNGPVIFCTAAVRDEDRKRAMRAGANAYLGKPVDPQVLREQMLVSFELADMESLDAKLEEERAIEEELKRRAAAAKAQAQQARQVAGQAIERTARNRAYKAFIESGGTRANFDRWWPQVFGSARANNNVSSGIERPGN
jgi:CheY-like chemotaxis protein